MGRWPVTNILPGNAPVTAYFVGLMAFCYNNQNQCEIGFPEAANHQLSIAIFENHEGGPIYLKAPGQVPEGIMSLGLAGATAPNVEVFHGEDFDETNRRNGENYDFRWLIDLEDVNNFNGVIPKKNQSAVFRRRLLVSAGTFFTHLPTCAGFGGSSGFPPS